jgi:hypothetical protein
VNGKFNSELLNKFKKSHNLSNNSVFKPQEWIPVSPAFSKAVGLPGLPKGHITLLIGLSDTGKSTTLFEAAAGAQKQGDLVVFIINEMKFSWDRVRKLGFQVDETVDEETGEVMHTGDFIYADRLICPTIETTGAFILDILKEQSNGKLPYNITFCIDSMGSLPSDMSVSMGKNDARWNSAASNLTWGSFVNHHFPMSRKSTSPYTNTLIVVNKQGIQLPTSPVDKPKRIAKGGSTLYFDASLAIAYGNISNSGVSNIDAVKNTKSITFAKRTKVAVMKNHITNSTASSKIIMTDYGFIEDTPAAINKYKEEHKHEWLSILGDTNFKVVEATEENEDNVTPYPDLIEQED